MRPTAREALFERLEPRTLLSVSIDLDFSLDAGGFFDDADRRAVVEFAADALGSLLEDSFSAIEPGGPNRWTQVFTDPGTGEQAMRPGGTIEADSITVFVGARDLPGTTLGLGGAGGWQASGTQAFIDSIDGRGQPGALGPDASRTDVGLWGGSLTFDSQTTWHAGVTTGGLDGGEFDLLSVALHEMTHLLGFSDSTPAFANLISGSTFTGSAAQAEADTAPALEPDDPAHWREGLFDNGQEVAMDPSFARGVRKLLTPLDLAAMGDIGWELAPDRWPGLGERLALATGDGDGLATGAAGPDRAGLHWFTLPEGRLLDVRVDADAPVTLRLWDSAGRLVAENAQPDPLAALAQQAGAQFYSVEVVSATPANAYTISVTTGEEAFLAFSPEGFASAAIDQTVWVTNTTDTTQSFTLTLRYENPALERAQDVVAQERLLAPGERVGLDIARDGVLATDAELGRAILADEPYALVLASTAPLDATLEHADVFGGERITTAEDFTGTTNAVWAFPRVEKSAGEDFDFLVYFNPNDHDARVTIEAITPQGTVRLTQVVGAQRRGGLSVADTAALPEGAFGVLVSSEAADPADQLAHVGLVAAQSHYDARESLGWTALGVAGGVLQSGAQPLSAAPGARAEVFLFNPSATTPARVSLGGQDGPTGFGSFLVMPGESRRVGLDGPGAGVSFEVTQGVALTQVVQVASGEAAATAPSGAGARDLSLGQARLDPDRAGEESLARLGVFNADDTNASVTVRLTFATGPVVFESVLVSPGTFATVALDGLASVRDRAADGPFAVTLRSTAEVIASLFSFDALTGVGFASTGRPMALDV